MGILIDEFKSAEELNATHPARYNAINFDWNSKVIDLIPDDWKLKDDWAFQKANLRDILSHMSGLPRSSFLHIINVSAHPVFGRHDLSYGPYYTAKELVRKLRFLEPLAELRETWQYNNQVRHFSAIISRI